MVGVIRVHFFSDRGDEQFNEYDYFWDGDAKVGDHAVVQTGVLKVVKVVAVFKRKTAKATKWALTVFNLDDVKNRQVQQQQRAELLEQMLERSAEKKQLDGLRAMAGDDAVMAELLKQYDAIGGNDAKA